MRSSVHPEILAPGGDQLSIRAAIAAGADAVYLGYGSYNARRNADSLKADELKSLSLLAKSHQCSLYITLNTLLTSDELDNALKTGLEAISLGADALIIQDLGLARLLRKLVPEIPLHASTQCTSHNKAQLEFLAANGFTRVNLGRELNIDEITEITTFAHSIGMETEVFVHGAYCVGFSGQCYMSSFMGGRSGNRGICFQPCRRPYLEAGNTSNDPEYLLSLKDNNAIELSDQLIEAGIDSLKIEGRLKNFQYVYSNVSAWSSKIKALLPDEKVPLPGKQSQVFNRGFDPGYLSNNVTSQMHSGRPQDRSLEVLGEVESFNPAGMILSCKSELPEFEEIMIYQDEQRFIATGICEKTSYDGKYSFKITGKLMDKIETGQRICRSPIRSKASELESWLMNLSPAKLPLNMKITGTNGTKLKLEAAIIDGAWMKGSSQAESEITLQLADKNPLTPDNVIKQLSKLGGTPFVFNNLEWNIEGDLFITIAQLNLLRRNICEGISENLLAKKAESALNSRATSIPVPDQIIKKEKYNDLSLIVLCKDLKQIDKLLSLLHKDDRLLIEVPLLSGQSIENFLNEWPEDDRVLPYLPSIIPDHSFDTWLDISLKILEKTRHDSFVCDNSGMGHKLGSLSGKKWIPGIAMNLSNNSAVLALEESSNVTRFIPSLELSREQLDTMIKELPGRGILPIAGPIVLMTTAQCMTRCGINEPECPKKRTDINCFKTCDRRNIIKDDRDRAFTVLKSPGYFARIFNQNLLWIPEAIRDLGNNLNAVLVDIRNVNEIAAISKKESDQISYEIVESVIEILREKSRISNSSFAYPGGLTRGNYQRGLS